VSATKCNKEGCWDGPAAGMVNLVQEPRPSLGKGGFVQLYIKHEELAHEPALSYFLLYSLPVCWSEW